MLGESLELSLRVLERISQAAHCGGDFDGRVFALLGAGLEQLDQVTVLRNPVWVVFVM